MKKLLAILVMAALACGMARAKSLVVYRPYATDTFTCSYVSDGGTPAFGTIEATCEDFMRTPVGDYVFLSNFDDGSEGSWGYDIDFVGRNLRQEGCWIVMWGFTTILSCQ